MKVWQIAAGGLALLMLVYFLDPFIIGRRRKARKLKRVLPNLNLDGFDAAEQNKDS